MTKNKKVESARIDIDNIEDTMIKEKPKKKIYLDGYHSKEYLSKVEKAQKEEVLFILPNGKEIENAKEN